MRSIIKTGLFAIVFGATASIGQTAAAGENANGCCGSVIVLQSQNKAYGLLADARNSTEPAEKIGCTVSAEGLINPTSIVQCVATNKFNDPAVCESDDPGFVKVAQAVSNFSWMYFEWDEYGECSFLSVRIGSAYLPDIEKLGL